MYHFFVDTQQIQAENIIIEGTDVNHMKNVLRMKPGQELRISDGRGQDYICVINKIDENLILTDIVGAYQAQGELPSKIYLFQGLPKSDKMELIIQKAVELGVYEIIPVSTKRAVVKLDAKKEQSKLKRWQGISESAAKQSKRGIIPNIAKVMTYSQALSYAETLDIRLIPFEHEKGMHGTREVIDQITAGQAIGIFIGPEGGFEDAEIDLAIKNGWVPISLGNRILRTETAGFTILSILMYYLEVH